jgi:hypothetical protein
MTLGPIDLIVLEFPGNQFRGEILPSLMELVDRGVIGIYDLLIIRKDQEGVVLVREFRELDETQKALLNPLKSEGGQMITREDIGFIADRLDNNCTAALMLIENAWARKALQAMLDANGKLLLFERIPHSEVEEGQSDIAGQDEVDE